MYNKINRNSLKNCVTIHDRGGIWKAVQLLNICSINKFVATIRFVVHLVFKIFLANYSKLMLFELAIYHLSNNRAG